MHHSQIDSSTQNNAVLSHLVLRTDTLCLLVLLCPLRLMSANASRLRLSSLAVSRVSRVRHAGRADMIISNLGRTKKKPDSFKSGFSW